VKAKPAPKPKAAAPSVKPGEAKRLAEAEARAARLAAENAKLQEALAKKDQPTPQEIKTPEAALAELKLGNQRFAEGRRVRTLLASQDAELRQALVKGQAPFAVIVTCSDSRLMDNFIFDQELGRLFTIREAGNCPDTQGVASVEYAVEHLGSKIVVVLGHTGCGAVKAVSEAGGKPLPGNLWSLQAAMAGLLETTHEDPNESAAEHLRHLEKNNAIRQTQAVLDRSEIVRHLVAAGKLRVLPAVYDLPSGRVSFLELPKAPQGGEKAHH
jgi:carbonic anhydrase